MKKTTKKIKIAILFFGMFAFGAINAQTTATGDAKLVKDTDATKLVRLIDNKGTIKYLQSKNGITQITSTTGGSTTTTTWQLGGALTDNTYIDLNGNVFGLNGVENATTNAATVITSGSSGTAGATETGWALLVREEATGKTQKVLFSDLIESAHEIKIAVTDAAHTAGDISPSNLTYTMSFAAEAKNIMVYRNGAKLLATLDYTVSGSTITLVPKTTAADVTAGQDWNVLSGDRIEFHYSKQ